MLAQLFDLSMLKFQQRDDIAETFRKYNRKVRQLSIQHHQQLLLCAVFHLNMGNTNVRTERCMQVLYDMQKAWDARSHKFYGTRYDYRRNAVWPFLQ